MEVSTVTSLGGLLFIVAIGALIYFAMEKGGGSCSSGPDHDKDQGGDNEHPKGGCC